MDTDPAREMQLKAAFTAFKKRYKLTVLNDDNEEQQHLALPFEHDESLARAIRAHHDQGKTVTLVAHRAMGIEQIVAFKVSADCGK